MCVDVYASMYTRKMYGNTRHGIICYLHVTSQQAIYAFYRRVADKRVSSCLSLTPGPTTHFDIQQGCIQITPLPTLHANNHQGSQHQPVVVAGKITALLVPRNFYTFSIACRWQLMRNRSSTQYTTVHLISHFEIHLTCPAPAPNWKTFHTIIFVHL